MLFALLPCKVCQAAYDSVVLAVHRVLNDKSPDVRVAAAKTLEKLTDYRFADDVDWADGSSELLTDEAARFLAWWRSR